MLMELKLKKKHKFTIIKINKKTQGPKLKNMNLQIAKSYLSYILLIYCY